MDRAAITVLAFWGMASEIRSFAAAVALIGTYATAAAALLVITVLIAKRD